MKSTVILSLALSLAPSAYAQLAAPNAAGVAMGHVHLNVADVDVHKKLWVEHFGAVPLQREGITGVSLPGMLILFNQQPPTGGSVGTVLDHFGFKVPNLAKSLQRWRAAGYQVEREFTGTEGFPNAYLRGPDDIKIELQQDTALQVRAVSYHLHYVLAPGDDLELRDWYTDTFSLVSRKRGEHDTADVPGINLTFSSSKTPPTIPTKGRTVDHVGFEVRNLEAFCKKLEARGVKFDAPYKKLAERGLAIAFFTDPFGVYVELTEGLDKLSGRPATPNAVQFRPHVIDAKVPGGYAVAVVDMNKDGKPDVIGVTQRIPELAWHENPTWERHVIADGMPAIVNLAASDIDGDGTPEVAVENAFAMVPAKSEGLVWLLRSQGDPRQRWKEQRIDAFSTSHHLAWADIDGDGKKELINAPLVGPKGLGPTYDQDKASLFWYGQGKWQRMTIAEDIRGILHRVRPVFWDKDRRSELLTASFDGITLYRASGRGANVKWDTQRLSPGHTGEAPRLGASDVGAGQINGKRFLASVEPWHGNEIVVYTEAGGSWQRRVLFEGMLEGHEVAVADFNGDGRDDIVAGDRNAKTTGVHVLYAPADVAGAWHHQVLDPGTMAASGCVTADINSDRRPDIVCIGSSTANINWYENLGTQLLSSK